jgi:hypothetical protein
VSNLNLIIQRLEITPDTSLYHRWHLPFEQLQALGQPIVLVDHGQAVSKNILHWNPLITSSSASLKTKAKLKNWKSANTEIKQ